jgi:hypothetical protein
MRPIRASEVGAFLYCHRAWWYQRQGVESSNQADLAGGNTFHYRHGRQVMAANMLRLAAGLVLALALIILVVSLTTQVLK